MIEGTKTKENEIVVILGRSQSFGLDLIKQHKLPFSYLNFDFSVERLKNNLKPHLRKTDNLKIGDENPVYEIHAPDTDTLKIYFINLFTYANICKTGTLTCILQTLIKDNKYNPDNDQLFYFCHGSDFGKSGFLEGPIEDNEKEEIIKSINNLPINKKISSDKFFIATFYHELGSRIFSTIKEKIEHQKLSSLNVKELYESFDKEKLEDTKKKLINTFLPLILDIKGFNEVSDKKSKDKYLEEIKGAINEYGVDLINNWNEIKLILALKVDKSSEEKEVLSGKFILKNKFEQYLSPLESDEKPGFSVQDIMNLFTDSKKDARGEVLSWFNRTIRKINETIEQKIVPKSEPESEPSSI